MGWSPALLQLQEAPQQLLQDCGVCAHTIILPGAVQSGEVRPE